MATAPEPYVAIENIYLGNSIAHFVGEVVPDENVEHNGWQKLVARHGSKTAEKAVDSK